MDRYFQAVKKRLYNLKDRFQESYHLLFATRKGRFERYAEQKPNWQIALDLFKDEWASQLPPPFQELKAGKVPLFEDERLNWAIKEFGGVQNKKILELGPLEGGHSFQLQKAGAHSVTAIEANPKAFLRCLLIKQMYDLNRVDFLFGDFMEYLRTTTEKYDACIASGVLYHMQNPVELIALAGRCVSQLFIWTHYYDSKICNRNFEIKLRFTGSSQKKYENFSYTAYHYHYGSARKWKQFCGGPLPTTNWLTREDIIKACHYAGFTQITPSFEERNNPHGPSFAFIAKK